MGQPTVSVIIPCFNSGRYIYEAVASAREQRGNFNLTEIIIVDDNSDETETLEAFQKLKEDNIVKIVHNRFSKGPGGARNTGIEMVDSEWVAFLDADDILTPNSIGARINALGSAPETKWCGGDFVKFYADSPYKNDPVYRSGRKYSAAFDGYHFDKPLLIEKPFEHFMTTMITWMGAVLIRTEVLKKLKGFREYLFMSEDGNLFIRIALEHDFLFVPDVVLAKREHDFSLTQSKRAPFEWRIKNFKSLLKDPNFKPHYKLIRKRLKFFYRDNCTFFFKQHRYLSCLKELAWYACFKIQNKLTKS